MLIGLPCTVGMFIFAQPILNLLFPNANDGALILQISALTIIFTILDQTIKEIIVDKNPETMERYKDLEN